MMILPELRATLGLPAARQATKTPLRLSARTASQSASVWSKAGGAFDDAGVVDEEVEVARLSDGLVHEALDGGAVGEVGGDGVEAEGGNEGGKRCDERCKFRGVAAGDVTSAPERARARAMAWPRPWEEPVTSAT